MDAPRSPGPAADIRQWAENRAVANALEVRELEAGWATPERSFAAALELLDLWGALHGWPPAGDEVDRREDEVVWARFARLRRPFVR